MASSEAVDVLVKTSQFTQYNIFTLNGIFLPRPRRFQTHETVEETGKTADICPRPSPKNYGGGEDPQGLGV